MVCLVIAISVASGCSAPSASGRADQPTVAASSASPGSTSMAFVDVTFTQMMLAHDRQTVQICDLLLAKSDIDRQVRVLAEQMRRTRLPEIDQLAGWLAQWGLDESSIEHAHAGRTHGLLLPGQLAAFERAAGPAAQQAFLETMISHDRGALEIATTVLATGADPGVSKLAESTSVTAKEEIAQLETMLGR